MIEEEKKISIIRVKIKYILRLYRRKKSEEYKGKKYPYTIEKRLTLTYHRDWKFKQFKYYWGLKRRLQTYRLHQLLK